MPTPRKATRELLEPLAEKHTLSEMGRILSISPSTIARACQTYGLTPKRLKTLDYSDLPKLAETMYMAEIARHYGVSYGSMCKTCYRLGIKPIKQTIEQKREVAAIACAAARAAKPMSPRLRTQFKTIDITNHRPKYQDDLAAEYLRKFTHVYRCNERGSPDLKGKFWRYGGTVKTPEELIDKAHFKGWDEHAWRRAA